VFDEILSGRLEVIEDGLLVGQHAGLVPRLSILTAYTGITLYRNGLSVMIRLRVTVKVRVVSTAVCCDRCSK